MKAISFFGISEYVETTYVHPDADRKFTTPYVQEAIVELYKPETLCVLLTDEAVRYQPKIAFEPAWRTLEARLTAKTSLVPITGVPTGHSEDDVWKLFEQFTGCIDDGDSVLFDITNGFRSFPIVALLAISYLRVIRSVTVEGLIYGNFTRGNPETPLCDLMPIVRLMELTTATDQFLKTGSAQSLADLLKSGPVRDGIQQISQGLDLLRPRDVAGAALNLPKQIEAAQTDIAAEPPPIRDLLRRIGRDYGTFGVESPESDPKGFLLGLLQMMNWYFNKGLYVHVLSIAREWPPSLLCWHFQTDMFDAKERAEMELLLCGGTAKDASGIATESKYLPQWKDVREGKALRGLWGGTLKLANVRNDVLHAGFRKNPSPARDIVTIAENVIKEIHRIASTYGIVESGA